MSITRRFAGPLLVAAAFALVAQTTYAQRKAARTNHPQAERADHHGITEGQRRNMEARIATASAIVNRLESDAKALGRSGGWRRASLESLLGLSLAKLQRVDREAYSADSLASMIADLSDDPQVFGDIDQDLIYVPITPCRYVDTRNVGGRINGFRGFDLFYNGATHGGDAPCDPTAIFGVIGNDFGAVALNVTIVSPQSAPGFAAVKPTASAPITSVLNWYKAGPAVQAANQGIFVLDHSAVPEEFFVQTSGPVHVILDIFGAFLQPNATALQAVTNETTQSVANGAAFDFQTAACPTGYGLSDGGHNWAAAATNLWLSQSSANASGTAWQCRGTNQSGATVDFTCYARCARVPGR